MKTRVIHKGLFIVALPLLVELVIISSLWLILNATDKEQELVSQGCERGRFAGRLIFADFKLAYRLMEAWSQRNFSKLDEADKALQEARENLVEMRKLPKISDPRLQQMQMVSMEEQDKLANDFDELCRLSKEGKLSSVESIVHKQKDLINDLRESFSAVRKVHDRIEANLKKQRKHLFEWNQQLLMILAAGLALNLAAAAWLSTFFRKHFSLRIAEINQNARQLAEGKSTSPRQTGSDEISNFDSSFHDMEEQLKLAAARERALFENSADLICIFSEELQFVRVNRACMELFGREPEELTGKLLNQLVSKSYQFSKTESLFAEGKASKSPIQFDLTLLRPDGSTTETQWSATYSKSQRLWYCTAHDITEQRRIERLKSTFMQILSADFRQPLRQISNSFQSLLSDFGAIPDTAGTKIKSSINTLKRLVTLVDKLLQVDRIDSRKQELERHSCSASVLIKAAVADLLESASSKGIEIEVESHDLSCYADEQSIVRVIVNLLSNAIKFSPANSKIRISAEQLEKTVKFKVTDQGNGIPAEVISRLFQAFQQSSAEDGKRGQGTGLGLLICKQEVEMHGGRIGVDSELEKGSTFWFEIPQISPHFNSDIRTLAKPNTPVTGTDLSTATDPRTSAAPNIDKAPSIGTAPSTGKDPNTDTDPSTGKDPNTCTDPSTSTAPSTDMAPSTMHSKSFAPLGSRISLSHKMKILIGIPLIFELVFVGLMTVLMIKASSELDLQFKQLDVLSETTTLNTHLYVNAFNTLPIKRKEKTQEQWKEEAQKLDKRFAEFEAGASQDPIAKEYISRLHDQIEEFKIQMLSLRPVPTNSLSVKENQIMKVTWDASLELNHLINYLNLRETQSPEIRHATRQNETKILLLGLMSNFVLAVVLAIFFSLDISRRFMLLSDNSNKLAAGLPLNPKMAGSDEIAQLDETFHAMAKQLKETREKESAFLDNSQEIILSTDSEGKVTAINQAVERLLKAPPNSIKNASISLLLKEEERSVLESEFELCKKQKQTRKAEFGLMNRETGQTVETLLSVSWTESEQAFFCIAHDISKQKEIDQIRREFISIITHDLRSPLSAIIFSVRVLEAGAYGEMPESCLPVVESISNECFRVVELINDLLDLEKLSAGQMKLESVELSLQELIQKTMEFFDKAQLADDVETARFVEVRAVPAELKIRGDKERLPRAMGELLRQIAALDSNSPRLRCFGEEDKVIVEVAARPGSQENKESVQKTIDLLCNPLELDLDPNNKGRLRVPLALRILHAHAATISIESQEDATLIVRVHFPLV